MDPTPEDLYLDLLKKTLSFALWQEPPVPVDVFNYRNPPFKRWLLSVLSQFCRSQKLQLVQSRTITREQREIGRRWSSYAHTMIGFKRLDNLQYCIDTALHDGVEGDLIETGVWRGGSCIFMRGLLAARGIKNRKVFVADSFEGLPKPDAETYPADAGDDHHVHTFLAIPQSEVEENFRKYGLLDDQVVFLKGWFKDTLPTAPVEKLAVLRLDGDMYSSTIEALTHLYPKLSKGGFCIVDDYALEGCKKAVEDYRRENGITDEIKSVDWTGSYWRKA